MKIGVVGLGLIGGAVARAMSASGNEVYGFDIDESVIKNAVDDGVICEKLTEDKLCQMQVTVVALYPQITIDYVSKNKDKFAKGSIVVDCSGTKRMVCQALFPIAKEQGFCFIGGHPMAGTEKWGYSSSHLVSFAKATMLLTPDKGQQAQTQILYDLFMNAGFAAVKVTTPSQHDRVIALTSQLAHVVSSAYIKSPVAMEHHGFSAGSFRDMTRVASLNADMWTGLFMENGDYLCDEIDALIERLAEYSAVIRQKDGKKLKSMLEDGKEIAAKLKE